MVVRKYVERKGWKRKIGETFVGRHEYRSEIAPGLGTETGLGRTGASGSGAHQVLVENDIGREGRGKAPEGCGCGIAV